MLKILQKEKEEPNPFAPPPQSVLQKATSALSQGASKIFGQIPGIGSWMSSQVSDENNLTGGGVNNAASTGNRNRSLSLTSKLGRKSIGAAGIRIPTGSGVGGASTHHGHHHDTSNMKQEALYQNALNHEVKLLYTTKLETRLNACANISYITWNACDAVQKYLIHESHAIDLLVNIINDHREDGKLRLEALKSIHVLLRSGKTVFKHILETKNIDRMLMQYRENPDIEFNKWIISTIYYIIIIDSERCNVLLSDQGFIDWIQHMKLLSEIWKDWPQNDAENLSKVLDLGKSNTGTQSQTGYSVSASRRSTVYSIGQS